MRHWYAAVCLGLIAVYPAIPYPQRSLAYLLVTCGVLPPVLVAVRREGAAALPWWTCCSPPGT